MNRMPLRPVRFVATALLASPLALLGQAAAEYALRSAKAISVDSGTAIAGCPVDSALLTCLGHSYPRTAILAAVVLCLVIVRWLVGTAAYRAR
jgi:hypothetical protein